MHWVGDTRAASAFLREELREGDIVLLKSSHASGLAALGDQLLDPAAARRTQEVST